MGLKLEKGTGHAESGHADLCHYQKALSVPTHSAPTYSYINSNSMITGLTFGRVRR